MSKSDFGFWIFPKTIFFTCMSRFYFIFQMNIENADGWRNLGNFQVEFLCFLGKWQSEKTTEIVGALNFHSKSRSFVFFFWKSEICFFLERGVGWTDKVLNWGWREDEETVLSFVVFSFYREAWILTNGWLRSGKKIEKKYGGMTGSFELQTRVIW